MRAGSGVGARWTQEREREREQEVDVDQFAFNVLLVLLLSFLLSLCSLTVVAQCLSVCVSSPKRGLFL